MLVLAPGSSGCVGVDLGSGALVRACFPSPPGLVPYDVAVAPLGEPSGFDELGPPEAVTLRSAPRRVGRLTGRRAERYLRPLLHPRNVPLLGFRGPAIPFWMLTGERPTAALFEPDAGPELRATPSGPRCRFGWHGAVHDLPVDTGRPIAPRSSRNGGRLCVVLGPPQNGYCYKLIAGVLPRP